jgi:proteasome lid subunit RPN8/RPN11
MRNSGDWRKESEMLNNTLRDRSAGARGSLPAEILEWHVGARFIAPACDFFSGSALDQIEAHALSEAGEVCGLIYPHRYLPLRNISPRPDREFYADPSELARCLFLYGEPLAIFHTHPTSNLELSTEDNKLWYYRNSTMIVGCIDEGRLRWKMYGNRGD